jgi:5-deoxy-glucuronate isomerase
MYKSFGYPEFNASGEQILTTYNNEYSNMLMDIRVYKIKADEERIFCREGEEIAILLLAGKITYIFDEQKKTVSRKDVFTEGPWCVHVCSNTKVIVKANSDAEILVQCTKNEKQFPAKLYAPKDVPWGYSCAGKFGNTAQRQVNTIFDYDTAPYSNMVLGEVINDRGNWSGYLPHYHPQPIP